MDDAALGSATIERRGGRVLVQDPAEADYDSMPRSAIAASGRPIVLPAVGIANHLADLAREAGPDESDGRQAAMTSADKSQLDAELEAEVAGLLDNDLETNTQSRRYSDLTCPECGGPLYSAREDRSQTYDCLVGHRWSPQSLFEEQSASVERALWLAVRSLEERGRLVSRLADASRQRGHPLSAVQFDKAAAEARQAAEAIREVAGGMTAEVSPEPGDGASQPELEPREAAPGPDAA